MKVGRSSRQGCTLAGESPVIPIAQFGYIAMPQPGAGNHPGNCVVYKASLPRTFVGTIEGGCCVPLPNTTTPGFAAVRRGKPRGGEEYPEAAP